MSIIEVLLKVLLGIAAYIIVGQILLFGVTGFETLSWLFLLIDNYPQYQKRRDQYEGNWAKQTSSQIQQRTESSDRHATPRTAQEATPNDQPAEESTAQEATPNDQPAEESTAQVATPNDQPAEESTAQEATLNDKLAEKSNEVNLYPWVGPQPRRWDQMSPWLVILFPLAVPWLLMYYSWKITGMIIEWLWTMVAWLGRNLAHNLQPATIAGHIAHPIAAVNNALAGLIRRKTVNEQRNWLRIYQRDINKQYDVSTEAVILFLVCFVCMSVLTVSSISLLFRLLTVGGYSAYMKCSLISFAILAIIWAVTTVLQQIKSLTNDAQEGNSEISNAQIRTPRTRVKKWYPSLLALIIQLVIVVVFWKMLPDLIPDNWSCLPENALWEMTDQELNLEDDQGISIENDTPTIWTLDPTVSKGFTATLTATNNVGESLWVREAILFVPEEFSEMFYVSSHSVSVGKVTIFPPQLKQESSTFSIQPDFRNNRCGYKVHSGETFVAQWTFAANNIGTTRGDITARVEGKRFLGAFLDDFADTFAELLNLLGKKQANHVTRTPVFIINFEH
ncbi:MAG: hypothetical protein KC418_12895 [Anaerolineales bacterium]|nr:hypothetical protein [Anaerolineales bacterium]